jgi:hypothetical protein
MMDKSRYGPRKKARSRLFISRGKIVTRRSRARGDAFRTRPVRATATSRESFAFAAIAALEAAAIDLWLRSGDEGGQAVNASIRNGGLRLLLLKWRLAALFAVILSRLVLFARLIGLLMIALAVVAWLIRLLLHRNESRLLAEVRKALVLVAILRGHLGIGPWLWLVLAELLLGRGNQAEVMLGMLVVIFRSDRVAGGARITRELDVFFGDVRRSPADFDVRSVGFEHPRHRVLTTPVIVIVVVIIVPVTHPFVVLTVSHVVPLIQP